MPDSVKLKEEIRKYLPRLLEEDEKFRREVSILLSEGMARRDELGKILEEMRLSREESNKRFEAIDRRFEQMDKRFEALILEMRTGFQTIDRRLSSIGQRWGIQTEEAVRQFAVEFIASEFGVQATEWHEKDAQLDLIIKNGEHFAIEVKSSVNDKEVEKFIKHVHAYCKQSGIVPKRKMLITAHCTGRAYKKALAEGIEIISG